LGLFANGSSGDHTYTDQSVADVIITLTNDQYISDDSEVNMIANRQSASAQWEAFAYTIGDYGIDEYDGTWTTRASDSTTGVVNGDTCILTTSGDLIRFEVPDQSVNISYNPGTRPYKTATIHGLADFGDLFEIRDFLIEDNS